MSLRWLLPPAARETVAGDLEEMWRTGHITRGRWWRLAVMSAVACWIAVVRGGSLAASARGHDRRKGDSVMSTVLQDVTYGLRVLRRAPGFTAAAVLTIALGIGINAATFSIVDVLSLKPLNYRNPERVAFILGTSAERQQRGMNLALADAIDIGRQMQSFEGVAAYQYWSANITGGERPERIQAYRVTANTFALVGVDASIGRALSVDDGRPDAPAVVLLSHGLWRDRFGADGSIVGRTVMLDGEAHTVAGVMPPRFEFPVFNFKGEAWTAIKGTTETLANRAGTPSIVAIARLKPDVSYKTAQSELSTVMRRLEADHPQTNRGLSAELVEMRRLGEVFQPAPISLIALTAVGVVLLLACANVANLLLARSVVRERELAVRAALGAGRGRILRQLLTESALLATAGAALGLAFAFWGLRLLRGSLPELLLVTQPNVLDLGIDRSTLAFTLAATIVSVLLFGGLPALRAARGRTNESLKAGGHGVGGPRHQRLRAMLMVAEVALSVVLLAAAGLLVRSFTRLQTLDTGFAADRVLTLTITLPEYRYGDPASQRRFFEQATDAVSRTPGVRSAAFVNVLPFSTYNRGTRYLVDGNPPPQPGREPATDYRVVTDDYFRALEIPVDAGRTFDSRDRDATERVAIVNRTFARRAFDGAPAVGRRIRFGRVSTTSPWRTIVGVVGDVRHSELTQRPQPEVYVPLAQAPAEMMMLAAKTMGNPDDHVDAVRAAIATVDPTQPVYHVKSLRDLVDQALLPTAGAMSMMTIFAGLALMLAAVGIYGVIAYAVSQQSREFGVRLALGASPPDLVRLVLKRGLSLVTVGAAIGIVAALGATRLLGGMLYGVTSTDPATYVVVCGSLLAVAAIACYLPARRVARLDPAVVLRAE